MNLAESLRVTNVEDPMVKMAALRDIGVRFSLDDFGTDSSSLFYLKRQPLNQIKIEPTFVRGILVDVNDAVIAKKGIALAGAMALDVIRRSALRCSTPAPVGLIGSTRSARFRRLPAH